MWAAVRITHIRSSHPCRARAWPRDGAWGALAQLPCRWGWATNAAAVSRQRSCGLQFRWGV